MYVYYLRHTRIKYAVCLLRVIMYNLTYIFQAPSIDAWAPISKIKGTRLTNLLDPSFIIPKNTYF